MNSPGHRANILNGNFREVGLGVEVGDYRGRESAFVTENFAKTGSDLFLTGVAFEDQDGDIFYDPGEGLAASPSRRELGWNHLHHHHVGRRWIRSGAQARYIYGDLLRAGHRNSSPECHDRKPEREARSG